MPRYKLSKLTASILTVIGLTIISLTSLMASPLLQRSMTLSDVTPGSISHYKLAFTVGTASTLGSIRLQFCANDPIVGGACTIPNGFDAQAAAIVAQTGETGFTVSNLSTAHELILSRIPTVAQAIPVEYELANITNPSALGSFYTRLETFASNDASGPATDEAGLALSINDLLSVRAEVPPYLTMCTAQVIDGLDCSSIHGNYVDFGTLSSVRPASGSSQVSVVTNAVNGYGLSIEGSTLASGNNAISAMTNPGISRPGQTQFGINLRANSNPSVGSDTIGPGSGQPRSSYNTSDYFVFRSGDTIGGSDANDDYRKYTVSYLVNVPAGQPPGIYVSTVTYIAVGNF